MVGKIHCFEYGKIQFSTFSSKKKKFVVKLDTFGFEMEKGGSFRHKSAVV